MLVVVDTICLQVFLLMDPHFKRITLQLPENIDEDDASKLKSTGRERERERERASE